MPDRRRRRTADSHKILVAHLAARDPDDLVRDIERWRDNPRPVARDHGRIAPDQLGEFRRLQLGFIHVGFQVHGRMGASDARTCQARRAGHALAIACPQ